MDVSMIHEAFRLGAGAVLYSGCHKQDCHYITGQQVGASRAERLKKQFDKLGMTAGRFRIEWISAAQGDKYARVLNEMAALLDGLPKDKLMAEIEALRPKVSKHIEKISKVPDVKAALDHSDRMRDAILADR
jgi:coenzyme F420-reducing hydrogenase delta subunit